MSLPSTLNGFWNPHPLVLLRLIVMLVILVRVIVLVLLVLLEIVMGVGKNNDPILSNAKKSINKCFHFLITLLAAN